MFAYFKHLAPTTPFYNFCLDISGTAIKFLPLKFHPSNVIHDLKLSCSCYNDWIVDICDTFEDDCETTVPALQEYIFEFDLLTVNQARVRFLTF